MSPWLRLPVLMLAAVALGSSSLEPGSGTREGLERPAHFRITREVVNPKVEAFATSNAGIGNSLVGAAGGFEPVIVQDAFYAQGDGVDEIPGDFPGLTRWDSYAEPLLDEAEVEIWRVVHGAMQRVRSDHVARDGAHFSGWLPVTPSDALIPPEAHEFIYRWDDFNRPDAHYYFNLRAVDRAGKESAADAWVEVRSPHEPKRAGASPDGQTRAFHPGMALSLGAPAAPAALTGDLDREGRLHLHWQNREGAAPAGYRLYRSDAPPSEHRGYFLQLAGHAVRPDMQIRRGDWVMWRKKLYRVESRLFSNRVWGAYEGWARYTPPMLSFPSDDRPGRHWELVPHSPDSPVTNGGETCLKLTLGAGEEARLELPNHSGTGQRWYDVLEQRPYQFSVWMRQDGDGSARFRFTGPFERQGRRILPQELRVGHDWKLQFGQFTPPAVLKDADPGHMGIDLRGPATFYLDNFEVHRADAPFQAWLPEDRQALHDSGMRLLRTHAFIKSQNLGYDLAQYTNAGGAIARTPKRDTLPQTLAAMKSAGVDPWLQIEMYFRPEDWRNLIEYLAAPYDPAVDQPERKPWAWKRYQQGHAAPWTDDFGSFYIELSNETWNRIFEPWIFQGQPDASTGKPLSGGTQYGLYQEGMISAMRSSPWWMSQHLESKFHFVIGGWLTQPEYGLDALRASPSSDFLTMAFYNGGWDWGQGPRPDTPASYFEILNDVSQTAIPFADQYQAAIARANAGRARPASLGTYESGPGYALNGLNGAQVTPAQDEAEDRVMKSLAAGTATLDAFLARAYRGFALQNFFGFSHGGKWGSHARWFNGGQAWPSWKLLALFNREGTGAMLRSETLSAPSWRLPATQFLHRGPIDASLAATYALRRGDRVMLFVLSRKVPDYPLAGEDGFTPADVELPFHHFRSAKVYRLTGNFADNNLEADRVSVESVALASDLLDGQTLHINAHAGADARGLPPGQTLLYVFEGTDIDVR